MLDTCLKIKEKSHSLLGVFNTFWSKCTLMLALLDFTLSSRQLLQQTVVFLTASVTERILFPVYHAVAASSEGASVLWLVAVGRLGAEAAIFFGWMG